MHHLENVVVWDDCRQLLPIKVEESKEKEENRCKH